MVRAPCCEKMGLKKGPWTVEEDQVLVSYIHRHGHGNWRALPKQAGLLRCGKSCRLRWTNYLRPDIKRGNFSKEEEDVIVRLHELLGNRWSAIAARLPGRTDNEIKNVWHTHLKKRRKAIPEPGSQKPTREEAHSESCGGGGGASSAAEEETKHAILRDLRPAPPSPWRSCSELSSAATDSSNAASVKDEEHDGSLEFPGMAEFLWWAAPMSSEIPGTCADNFSESGGSSLPSSSGQRGEDLQASASSGEDDMDFWLRLLMEAGDFPELPSL
ncbi:unnamed protein product [Spirodela intermedia]|uniref:Uncharacterized protein n=1 Tax=Spirodela intermedia TaxID=51605 RepID=A0A7I8KM73_SPIIN|nr:unnamed protein product [Spirodela intermedia]